MFFYLKKAQTLHFQCFKLSTALKVSRCEFSKQLHRTPARLNQANFCCPGDANYPEAIVVCVNQNQYACKLDMAQFIWVDTHILTSSQSLIEKTPATE